jgi:hypothetical protein
MCIGELFLYLTSNKYMRIMNRIVLLACTLLLFSCDKTQDYTCNCVRDNVQVKKEVYPQVPKHMAEDRCEETQASLNDTVVTHGAIETFCELY